MTLASDFDSIIELPEEMLAKYLKKLYNGWKGTVDKSTWEHGYNQFLEALQKGWGKQFAAIDFNSPDFSFITQLQYNTAVFNAFKNHKQSEELRSMLVDADGKVVPWKEFQQLAAPITEKYNQRWLQTEYNHAHQSALMARKWRDFQDSKDLYPNLEYVAVQDERTREDHAALDGVVYPIDHTFWDICYPPIDWNCRCTVRQTDKQADEDIPDDMPAVPISMQTNTGKTAELFSDKHPYYKGVDKGTKTEIRSFVDKNLKTEEDEA